MHDHAVTQQKKTVYEEDEATEPVTTNSPQLNADETRMDVAPVETQKGFIRLLPPKDKKICLTEKDAIGGEKNILWQLVGQLVGREESLKTESRTHYQFNSELERNMEEAANSIYEEICGERPFKAITAGITHGQHVKVEQWVQELKGKYASIIQKSTLAHELLHTMQNEYLSHLTQIERGSRLNPKKYSQYELNQRHVQEQLNAEVQACKDYQAYNLSLILELQAVPNHIKQKLLNIIPYYENISDIEKRKACQRLLPFTFKINKNEVIVTSPPVLESLMPGKF